MRYAFGLAAALVLAGPAIAQRIATAADVTDAFAAAGLPVHRVVVLNAATDPNQLLGRPGQYTSKVTFSDARRSDAENTVEVFATAAQARTRRDYIARITEGAPFLTQYQVLDGRILARFDRAMLPQEVEQYRSALAQASAR